MTDNKQQYNSFEEMTQAARDASDLIQKLLAPTPDRKVGSAFAEVGLTDDIQAMVVLSILESNHLPAFNKDISRALLDAMLIGILLGQRSKEAK
jgi:hypothetical protein